MKINKRFGFTLSEVMITILMIGIISVLTISTIASSMHSRARLSEFKTAYANLVGALNTVITENGHAYSCYTCPSDDYITKYGLNISEDFCNEEQDNFAECDTFETKFLNNLKATYNCPSDPYAQGCVPETYTTRAGRTGAEDCFDTNFRSGRAYILENSMIVIPDPNLGNIARFAVDINGKKGPNIWGQDIFTFTIVPSAEGSFGGTLIPTALRILPPEDCLPGKRAGADALTKGTVSTDLLLDEIWNYEN